MLAKVEEFYDELRDEESCRDSTARPSIVFVHLGISQYPKMTGMGFASNMASVNSSILLFHSASICASLCEIW